MPVKFGRRPFPHSSVILFTEWHNDHNNLRLVGGGKMLNALLKKRDEKFQKQHQNHRNCMCQTVNKFKLSYTYISYGVANVYEIIMSRDAL